MPKIPHHVRQSFPSCRGELPHSFLIGLGISLCLIGSASSARAQPQIDPLIEASESAQPENQGSDKFPQQKIERWDPPRDKTHKETQQTKAPATSSFPRRGKHAVEVDSALIAETDGAYGRFDGDLNFSLGLGARVGDSPAGALIFSVHEYSSVGLLAVLNQRLGMDTEEDLGLSVELDIRPLFIPRWSEDLQAGPAWLDLFIDSWGLGVGGYFVKPRGESFGEELGLLASIGFGLPLFNPGATNKQAHGLWLRARGSHRFGTSESYALLSLQWEFFKDSPWL